MKNVEMSLVNIESLPKLMHDYLECYLVVRGTAVAEVNGREYPMGEDDMIIIPPEDTYGILGNGDNMIAHCRVSVRYLNDVWDGFSACRIACNSVCAAGEQKEAFREIRGLFMKMLLIQLQRSEGYPFEFMACFFQFMQYLILHFADSRGQEEKREKERNSFDSVLRYVEDHYRQELTLNQMAKMNFISPQYFSKQFKQAAGVGFLQYLNQIRLRHAVSDLLLTEDSVIKIALQNGFCSAKAFTESFKREYRETPSDYRKKNTQKKIVIQNRIIRELPVDTEDGITELLNRIRRYEEKSRKLSAENLVRVNADSQAVRQLTLPAKIIHINHLHHVQNFFTIRQLEILQKRLDFQYVYCEAFCGPVDTLPPEFRMYRYYGEYKSLAVLKELGLIPFFKIDYNKVRRNFEAMESYLAYFEGLLSYLKETFYDWPEGRWMFELCDSGSGKPGEYHNFMKNMAACIHRVFPEAGIGLRLETDRLGNVDKGTMELLGGLNDLGRRPSFVTLTGWTAEAGPCGGSDNFEMLAGYHTHLIEQACSGLKSAGMEGTPLYMVEWNTLCAADSCALTGSFFRSALILRSLIKNADSLAGIGFWLDTYHALTEESSDNRHILALFANGTIKRPAYFVLDIFHDLAGGVLYEDEHLLVVRIKKDEYHIVFYNAVYANPLLSVEPEFMEQAKKKYALELRHMESGTYQIKKYVYNNSSDGAYYHWDRIGWPEMFDGEVERYLEDAIVPGTTIMKEPVGEEYTMHVTMEMNGIMQYRIRKM